MPNRGFTLIELSIALVVIGLIIGTTIAGWSLVRSSQVQSVISDRDQYNQAIQLFKEKYNYLPGDMPTATSFWGTDPNGCPDNTPREGQVATCDGNGNGSIDTGGEALRAWQQLADAGFIKGTYSGTPGNNGSRYSFTPGMDVPASQVPSCGWLISYLSPVGTTYGGVPVMNPAGHYLGLFAGGQDKNYPPCLTPAESYNIDAKTDDGVPGSGNMVDGSWAMAMCSNSTVIPCNNTVMTQHNAWPCSIGAAPPYSYNTTISGVYCDPFFYTGL